MRGCRVQHLRGIGTPSLSTFADSGLSASTSYSYRVRATDAAGNLDCTRHGQRHDLGSRRYHAADRARDAGTDGGIDTQINLTWPAATDAVGVTGYRVERCAGAGCSNFAQVGTPTTTSFNNTGLTASTSYSFRVRATDAAGNLGTDIRHGQRHDFGGRRHHAADCARHAGADGGLEYLDQPHLAGRHRCRRGHRLPGRALHRRQLQQLRPGRNADDDEFQQHRSDGQHRLQISGPRHRRGGQPWSLLNDGERHHIGGTRHDSPDRARYTGADSGLE